MEYTVFDIAVVPVIVALVSLIKGAGIPARLAPLLAVVLGIVAGIIYIAPGDLPQGIFVGLTVGLAASGLYSGSRAVAGAKNTIKPKEEPKD